MKSSDFLKNLPSVNDLLENPQLKGVVDKLNRTVVATRVRTFLDELKEEVSEQTDKLPTLREVVDRVTRYVARDGNWHVAGAINATGRLRSGPWVSTPLADAAVERMLLLSKDFATGEHGPTADAVAALKKLTGAEAAAIFSTRAGAMWLLLSQLTQGKQVIVARSEVGDIEPGCRLTDLCAISGSSLHEVGTGSGATVDDYIQPLQTPNSVVLRIAAEEYRMVGEIVPPLVGELSTAAKQHHATLVVDLAGGTLIDLSKFEGVPPTSAADAISSGADLVLLRGDGLVGGPECCMVFGKQSLVDAMVATPLAQAFAPDAHQAAMLAATLELLADEERVPNKVPILSLISTPLENLRSRANRLAPQIAASPAIESAEVIELSADSAAISGTPWQASSVAIAVTPADGGVSALADHLQSQRPALWPRQESSRLLLDLRTVFPRQDMALVDAFPPAGGTPAGETQPVG